MWTLAWPRAWAPRPPPSPQPAPTRALGDWAPVGQDLLPMPGALLAEQRPTRRWTSSDSFPRSLTANTNVLKLMHALRPACGAMVSTDCQSRPQTISQGFAEWWVFGMEPLHAKQFIEDDVNKKLSSVHQFGSMGNYLRKGLLNKEHTCWIIKQILHLK